MRYLGVNIDRDLTWKAHIEKVRHQCKGKLAAIRRAGAYLPCHVRKMLYQSLVLSHLDYCSVVWNSCRVTLGKRIERVQNYALRLILQKPPLTSSDLLRQTLGWTTLDARRQNVLLCQVHRCVSNQTPSYLCSRFTPDSSLHYAETRGSTKLPLPNPNGLNYHTSFEFQWAKIFNKLPKNTRDLKEKKLFRDAMLRLSSSSNL